MIRLAGDPPRNGTIFRIREIPPGEAREAVIAMCGPYRVPPLPKLGDCFARRGGRQVCLFSPNVCSQLPLPSGPSFEFSRGGGQFFPRRSPPKKFQMFGNKLPSGYDYRLKQTKYPTKQGTTTNPRVVRGHAGI